MDRRERYLNEEETFRLIFTAMQSRLWTALPGIVERFDPARMTVDVKPAINGRLVSPTGEVTSVQMPILPDCPVQWVGGGGATLTFPIVKGDECLVVFGARCIDAWWAQGGAKDPPDRRMHNLSDGIAIVGLRSLPRAFPVDTTHAMLRSDDGETFVRLDPEGQLVQITAPGGINLNGVMIDISGNVQTPGTVTADTDVVGGGKHLKTHTHPAGSPNTGPPNS